ncbi:hypothetical protein LI90_4257 [Carbonactinospora thermoautotrophica]|uniref:Uncharacterized protein n=1 Tax=Carbonactinospora thermoautotrophica TaxID=1469144 RepID=A0A132MZP8_9ACTN|nr:hypothetical protein [Carbonactinospora thermoautotrophica]KWX03206.1 hypothetical protein LI90_4257 [Carbonactinospora thermoautotrophica]
MTTVPLSSLYGTTVRTDTIPRPRLGCLGRIDEHQANLIAPEGR